MITTVKDDSDRVVAYAEWRQVGPSGFDVLGGAYIYIAQLWIHDDYKNTGLISEIITQILQAAPEAKHGYFNRKKYGDRMSKVFNRESFENRIKDLV